MLLNAEFLFRDFEIFQDILVTRMHKLYQRARLLEYSSQCQHSNALNTSSFE